MTTQGDQPPRQGQRAVVVVDDDAALLHSMQFALELEGYLVVTYSDASAMLAARTLPTTGCLVVDYVLPDMDGLELIGRVRARGVDMPAILITSHPAPSLLRRASATDVRVIEKPLLNNALSDAIAASFDGE